MVALKSLCKSMLKLNSFKKNRSIFNAFQIGYQKYLLLCQLIWIY